MIEEYCELVEVSWEAWMFYVWSLVRSCMCKGVELFTRREHLSNTPGS